MLHAQLWFENENPPTLHYWTKVACTKLEHFFFIIFFFLRISRAPQPYTFNNYLPNQVINTQSIVSDELPQFVEAAPCPKFTTSSNNAFFIERRKFTTKSVDALYFLFWGMQFVTIVPLCTSHRFTWIFLHSLVISSQLNAIQLQLQFSLHNFQFSNPLLTESIRDALAARTAQNSSCTAINIRLQWCVHNLLTCRYSLAYTTMHPICGGCSQSSISSSPEGGALPASVGLSTVPWTTKQATNLAAFSLLKAEAVHFTHHDETRFSIRNLPGPSSKCCLHSSLNIR